MENKGGTLGCVGFMVQRHSKKASGVVLNLIDRLARTMYVLDLNKLLFHGGGPLTRSTITGPLTFILKTPVFVVLLCPLVVCSFLVLYHSIVGLSSPQNIQKNHKTTPQL